MSENSPIKIRRYDLDWLRVILFGLLIPFHVAIGVYWSTYGADVNPNMSSTDKDDRKDLYEEGNDYTAESIDLSSMFLHWMHQWRLAALFMISGMGTAFAFRNRTWGKFLIERLNRLIVPMFFGMWATGFAGGILLGSTDLGDGSFFDIIVAFIWHVAFTSFIFWIPIIGKLLGLGHLWFLWNLFLYSLILTPVFNSVRKNPDGKIVRGFKYTFKISYGLGIMLLLPLLLAISEIAFKPWFPGFIGIGYEWIWFFIFFVFGYICIIAKDEYYAFLEERRILITALTVAWTLAFIWLRIKQHDDGIAYVDGGWVWEGVFHNGMTLLGCVIHSFHAWFWCLTVFSWAAHLLNRPSKHLAYLNQGVYPFYIVHMPLTFTGLSLAGKYGLKNYPAVIFATVIVVLGCWGLFEGLKRTWATRLLFGIKPLPAAQSVATQDTLVVNSEE